MRAWSIRKLLAILVVILTSVSLTVVSQTSASYDCSFSLEDQLDGEDVAKESAGLIAFCIASVCPPNDLIKQAEQYLFATDHCLTREKQLIRSRSQSLALHLFGTSPPSA